MSGSASFGATGRRQVISTERLTTGTVPFKGETVAQLNSAASLLQAIGDALTPEALARGEQYVTMNGREVQGRTMNVSEA